MKTILKRNLLLTLILVSLSALLCGCRTEKEENGKFIVDKSFVIKDSVEITIEQFLILAKNKHSTLLTVIRYFDINKLEYRMFKQEVNGYQWYDLYANDKKYCIGFNYGRMFDYFQ